MVFLWLRMQREMAKKQFIWGALQLLFDIKGKRWEDPNYGVKEWGLHMVVIQH